MSYRHRNRIMLAPDERVLWEDKPRKSAFLITKSTTLLPIAILWLIFDLPAIRAAIEKGQVSTLLFFALHLMPVWIWLGNTITAWRRYSNTNYYVTDRRIVIQYGYLAVNEISLYYRDIKNVHMRVGLIDKLFGVGDICFEVGYYIEKGRRNLHIFEELARPDEAYDKIQRIVLEARANLE